MTLLEERVESAFIRSDNGPEFIASAAKRRLDLSEVKTLYIGPGSPWENASYSETFDSCFGGEVRKREMFTSLLEAKALREEYRRFYNQISHSTLGYRTPARFAAGCDSGGVHADLTKEQKSVPIRYKSWHGEGGHVNKGVLAPQGHAHIGNSSRYYY